MDKTPKEITVIIKGSDSTYRRKHLVYDDCSLHPADPVLQQLVADTRADYTGEIDEIQIRASMQWI